MSTGHSDSPFRLPPLASFPSSWPINRTDGRRVNKFALIIQRASLKGRRNFVGLWRNHFAVWDCDLFTTPRNCGKAILPFSSSGWHLKKANSPTHSPPIRQLVISAHCEEGGEKGSLDKNKGGGGSNGEERLKTKKKKRLSSSSFPHPVFLLPPLGWMGLCILSSFLLPPIALRPAPKMKNGFSWGTPAAAGIAGSQGRSGGRGEKEKEQCPQPTR